MKWQIYVDEYLDIFFALNKLLSLLKIYKICLLSNSYEQKKDLNYLHYSS